MSLCTSIRLSNFTNRYNNNLSISFLEIVVQQNNQPVAISSITSNNSTLTTLSSLLTSGNSTPVTLSTAVYNTARSTFYIQLDLASSISTRKDLTIQFRAVTQFSYPFSFDIQFYSPYPPYNNPVAISYYIYTSAVYYTLQSKTLINYPGDGNFNSLPTLSSDYVNSTLTWDTTQIDVNNANAYIEDDNLYPRLQWLNSSYSSEPVVRTNLAPSSGKWLIEVIDKSGSSDNITSGFGVCNASYDARVSAKPYLGRDTAGNSLFLRGYSNEASSLYYKNSNTAAETLNLIEIYPPNSSPTINAGNINFSSWAPSVGIYYVAVDLDNRKLEYYNRFGMLMIRIKIPWSGPTYLCFSGVCSFDRSNYNLVYINLGYLPFTNPSVIPYGYTRGYGAEITVDYADKQLPYDFNKGDQKYVVGSNTSFPDPTIEAFRDSTVRGVYAIEPIVFDSTRRDVVYNEVPDTMSYLLHEYRGFGYLKSNVLKGTTSASPILTRVALLDILTNTVIFSTWTDKDTGEFEFTYISEYRKYNILAFDPALGWVTAIGGPFKATRMPGTEELSFIEP